MPDTLPQTDLMRGVNVLHLRFRVRALTTVAFAQQGGSALRGALYAVMAHNFCSEPFERVTPDHQAHCPVCWLLAQESEANRTGRNLPRPITVQPPPPNRTFAVGDTFSFGISLISRAQDFFPFVARAVEKMGQAGVGIGRGKFKLLNIEEHSPIQDITRGLMDGRKVKSPTLHVTAGRIAEIVPRLPTHSVVIQLRSPLRLVADGKLLRAPEPVPFVQRLIERCQTLAEHYGDAEPSTRSAWRATADALTAQAAQLKLAVNDTQWIEAWSGSARIKGYTPIGGLIGRFRWDGDLSELMSWLLWGQSLHVGKDTVKGNGWYEIIRSLQ